jgi:hypothetical protein
MDRQHDLFDANAARTRGHQAALAASDRAERMDPNWMTDALAKVKQFAQHQQPHVAFTIETLRNAIEQELPAPPDLRAWGAVTLVAAKKGLIERKKGAFAPAVSSNGSPKPMYTRGANAAA